jgi:hypothetical protein
MHVWASVAFRFAQDGGIGDGAYAISKSRPGKIIARHGQSRVALPNLDRDSVRRQGT